MFKEFADQVNKNFTKMSKEKKLFIVNIPNDTLWDIYLNSFPKGTNKIFRERREYDCQTCKSFIKRIGRVVSITENYKVRSVWSNWDNLPYPYDIVSKKMHETVVNSPVASLFLSDSVLAGKEYNFEKTENGSLKWEHFYVNIPNKFVLVDRASTIGNYETAKSVLHRALEEFSISNLDTVISLITDSSIYRGEEFLSTVKELKRIKVQYDKLDNSTSKHNFAWKHASNKIARIRNSAIGTLIIDIAKNMEIETAIHKYESVIVAPQNYKRPKSTASSAMKKEFLEFIESEGIKDSLYRKYAKLEDVSVNDVIYVDRATKSKMKDSIDDLLSAEPVVAKTADKLFINTTNIEDFIADIGNVTKLEASYRNDQKSNLVSLIAPVYPDSPNILKWGNNFSWSYNGDVTDSMKENVKKAGGNTRGCLRFSIEWNNEVRNLDDLDAACVQPDGSKIYFSNKISTTSGSLDVDIIHPKGVAVENIIFTDSSRMVEGIYTFILNNYTNRGGKFAKAQIEFDGKMFNYEFEGKVKDGTKVAEVTYKNGNFTINHIHKPTNSSTKVENNWSINSNTFNTVSSIMYSPNHWHGEKTGNKHYIFTINGCTNPDKIRGLYNEHLNEKYNSRRKSFDFLGEKLICEHSEDQVSGLGFSSTKRDDLLVKVTYNNRKTKLLKIKF